MTDTIWTWADLDERGLALVEEAERTLDADFVLVYRPGEDEFDVPAQMDLPPTSLDATQLDASRAWSSWWAASPSRTARADQRARRSGGWRMPTRRPAAQSAIS